MTDAAIYIRDSGKLKPSDSGTTYTQVNSGTWQQLNGFTISADFTNDITSNDANRTNSTYSHLLTFNSNEVVQIQAPRFTLRGVVPITDTTAITNLINFSRSKGVKRIKGGLGLFDILSDIEAGTEDAIDVIFKNTNMTEIYNDDTSNISFTINLEQVR